MGKRWARILVICLSIFYALFLLLGIIANKDSIQFCAPKLLFNYKTTVPSVISWSPRVRL